MLISIITATFNSQNEIVDTYNSLVCQTHSNWEWIVTDDCSCDNTYEILLKISHADPRVKVFRNLKNYGAAVSRNRSLGVAQGEFIAFIDSDDMWRPNKLEIQSAFMADNIDFSFTAYELINKNGELLKRRVDFRQRGSFGYEDMLRKRATLGCSTVMLRKSAFLDISMPLIRTGQDYATWLKLLKAGGRAYVIGEVLTSYRVLPNSISRNKLKKSLQQWKIYRDIEKLPILKSLICFCYYAWNATFRK